MDEKHLKEFVLLQLQRSITNLYKRFITSAEDLKFEHEQFTKKLIQSGVSPELVKKLDYFDQQKYNHIRKNILDIGNEMNRDLENHFKMINLSLNEAEIKNTADEKIKKALSSSKSASVKSTKTGFKVKGKLI
tara:strand:+ start:452 stop:850 length:399 start_codon:yes stop_codon:yes gene_type:complete